MYTYNISPIQRPKILRIARGKKDNYTVKTSFLEEKNFYAERLFMMLMYEASLS